MAEDAGGSRRKNTIPTIRKVLKNLSDEITDDELTKLIFLARDELPKGQTQNMTCLKLIGALEERQLIDAKNNDLTYLLDLLGQLPRIDLIKKLNSSLPTQYNHCTTITETVLRSNCGQATFASSATTVTFESDKKMLPISNRNSSGDGGFLQDPDVLNSTFQDYNKIIGQLEAITRENEDTLKALNSSEESKAILQRKVTSLEMELIKAKDEQNNLICERNNALAAKSEAVFSENEAKKEISEIKRTKLALEKSLSMSTSEVEKKGDEVKELMGKLEESHITIHKQEEEIGELKSKIEEITLDKKTLKKQLQQLQEKANEGNGRLNCKRCGLIFLEKNNPDDACRYHSGKYGMTGSLMKKLEWSCCKQTNKNAAGCCKKKHLFIDYPLSPNNDTSGKLTRLDTM